MGKTLIMGFLAAALIGPLAWGEDSAEEGRSAQDYFSGGTVESFRARRITLTYDLSNPDSLKDFVEANPFLRPQMGGFSIRDGKLFAKGAGALVHKGVFEADLVVEATIASPTPRDIGVVMVQPGMTDQFLLFALWDNFFCKKDRQTVNQHMITVVGAEASDGVAGESDFRYLTRATKPSLEEGREIGIKVSKSGDRNELRIGSSKLIGGDRYGSFPAVQPGLYVLESEMTVTALKISGRLTEAWLTDRGILFDPKERDSGSAPKIDAPKNDSSSRRSGGRGSGGRDRGRRGRRGGGSEAEGLIRTIGDRSASEEEREAAAAGLDKDNVKVNEFRALVDCLYSEDLMTRTLAITVLKKVTRKTLGYNPKAPEEHRRKAARKWFQYFMNNRERLR